jgi:hypothetical protein
MQPLRMQLHSRLGPLQQLQSRSKCKAQMHSSLLQMQSMPQRPALRAMRQPLPLARVAMLCPQHLQALQRTQAQLLEVCSSLQLQPEWLLAWGMLLWLRHRQTVPPILRLFHIPLQDHKCKQAEQQRLLLAPEMFLRPPKLSQTRWQERKPAHHLKQQRIPPLHLRMLPVQHPQDLHQCRRLLLPGLQLLCL